MSDGGFATRRSRAVFGLVGMITGIAGLAVSLFGLVIQYGAGTQKQAAFESDRRGCLRAVYDVDAAAETALRVSQDDQGRIDETIRPVLYTCIDSRLLNSESGFVRSWLDLYALTNETPGSLFGSVQARTAALNELRKHNAAAVAYLRALQEPSALQIQATTPSAPDAETVGLEYSDVCDAISASVLRWTETQAVGVIPPSIGKYDRLCQGPTS